MTTNDDGLLAALIAAVAKNTTNPLEDLERQKKAEAERLAALGTVEAAINGRPLALNDDAGLARQFGMKLSHDTYFTN